MTKKFLKRRTLKTIHAIKRAYNKRNISRKIVSSSSQSIYNELSEKLNKCNDESCWLQELDGSLRKEIQEKSFTPYKPVEWEKNPVEWLSNFDILDVLKQYEEKYSDFKFIGPTPIDFNSTPGNDGKCVWQELCVFQLQKYKELGYNNIGVIFNLDKHDQSGSHWVSLFISVKDNFIYYFDSAANEIPLEIKNFVELVSSQSGNKLKFLTNIPHQHQYGNTECGMYSLYFIITMLDDTITKKKKINIFSKRRLNDKFIQSFRNKYFN
jgi:hypothetical protein